MNATEAERAIEKGEIDLQDALEITGYGSLLDFYEALAEARECFIAGLVGFERRVSVKARSRA